MKYLMKFLCFILIGILAFINLKILSDYKIERPTEKYSIISKTKTAAKILNLDNTKPIEALEEETKEIVNEEVKTEEPKISSIEKTTEIQTSSTTQQIEENEIKNNNEAIVENTAENIIEEVVTVEQAIEENNETETTQEQNPEPTPAAEPTTSGSDIVSTAQSYLGYNYVSGGSSPSSGFDCSGFTQYVYKQYGINLNRTAADLASNGTPISKDELQPGDLVLFSYYGSGSIGHAGIYIGNGQMIHAANSKRGVVTDTINSGYYAENYVTARRLQ